LNFLNGECLLKTYISHWILFDFSSFLSQNNFPKFTMKESIQWLGLSTPYKFESVNMWGWGLGIKGVKRTHHNQISCYCHSFFFNWNMVTWTCLKGKINETRYNIPNSGFVFNRFCHFSMNKLGKFWINVLF